MLDTAVKEALEEIERQTDKMSPDARSFAENLLRALREKPGDLPIGNLSFTDIFFDEGYNPRSLDDILGFTIVMESQEDGSYEVWISCRNKDERTGPHTTYLVAMQNMAGISSEQYGLDYRFINTVLEGTNGRVVVESSHFLEHAGNYVHSRPYKGRHYFRAKFNPRELSPGELNNFPAAADCFVTTSQELTRVVQIYQRYVADEIEKAKARIEELGPASPS